MVGGRSKVEKAFVQNLDRESRRDVWDTYRRGGPKPRVLERLSYLQAQYLSARDERSRVSLRLIRLVVLAGRILSPAPAGRSLKYCCALGRSVCLLRGIIPQMGIPIQSFLNSAEENLR